MTEPSPMDRIREALDALAKAGPLVVGLALHPVTWETLRSQSTVPTWPSPGPGVGVGAVPVRLDAKLPRGALRWSWSDGSVTTRWPVVLDPKATQVRLVPVVFVRGQRQEHTLTLHTRYARKWLPELDGAGRSVSSAWDGPRVTAYLPGVSDVLKRELEPWQRDTLASLLKTRKAVGHRALNPETPPEG